MFGYCETGNHKSDDPEVKGCPGSYERWYMGIAGKEKGKRIPTGETVKCDCKCHGCTTTTKKKAVKRK